MLEQTDLLGAVVTVVIYVSTSLVFAFRLAGLPQLGHSLGYLQFLMAAPLAYLLFRGPALGRPPLYYVQVSLMLAFLLVELLLDYLFKVGFRQVGWAVVSYVVLFFAATGGLLGIAANSGRWWTIAAVVLFLIMAVLAFVQRSVTGI